jgi:branched-subunit amino acid transport protein
MSPAWTAVLVIGAVTIALKASGPLIAHGRELPGPLARLLDLLAPAVLAALVATQTFSAAQELVIDERTAGVAAAAAALAARAPMLAAVGVAATVTALLRLAA